MDLCARKIKIISPDRGKMLQNFNSSRSMAPLAIPRLVIRCCCCFPHPTNETLFINFYGPHHIWKSPSINQRKTSTMTIDSASQPFFSLSRAPSHIFSFLPRIHTFRHHPAWKTATSVINIQRSCIWYRYRTTNEKRIMSTLWPQLFKTKQLQKWLSKRR